jgi:SNW domain-containing protein 1
MEKDFRIEEYKGFKNNLTEKYMPREELLRPSLVQKQAVNQNTIENLEKQLESQSFSAYKFGPKKQAELSNKYIKYSTKDGSKKRIVRIQQNQVDPLCPPQYKSKRIPQGPRSPPEPLLRSPPNKIKLEENKNWKIPPCISNYKNSKGFLIPLNMRLSADGRSSQNLTISENFKKFTSALYHSEKEGRKYLEEKKKLNALLEMEEIKKQEEDLKANLNMAKQKKDSIFADEQESFITANPKDKNSHFQKSHKNKDNSDDSMDYSDNSEKIQKKISSQSKEEKQRDLIRFMLKKNIERDNRINELGKKTKDLILSKERDITERVALGEKVGDFTSKELKLDNKLVHLDSGLDSGFKGNNVYDLYDKPLFKEKVKVNIYSGVKEFNNIDGDDDFEFLKKKEAFTSKNGQVRSKPIVFEKINKKIKKE